MNPTTTPASGDLLELLDLFDPLPTGDDAVLVEGRSILIESYLDRMLADPSCRALLTERAELDPLNANSDEGTSKLREWLREQIAGGVFRLVLIERRATRPAAGFPETAPQDLLPEEVEETYWVEIMLVDMEDNPVPGEAYKVTLPDGTVHEGNTGPSGVVRLASTSTGNCQVTFPNLDEQAWEPC